MRAGGLFISFHIQEAGGCAGKNGGMRKANNAAMRDPHKKSAPGKRLSLPGALGRNVKKSVKIYLRRFFRTAYQTPVPAAAAATAAPPANMAGLGPSCGRFSRTSFSSASFSASVSGSIPIA